ncbi:hypothetical protein [Amnibacterium sp.]|uniref:hypothetical protein n=1 Tax=Amnibacterium sp. TaxID=1872496 RepID=UPI003F7B93E4
MSVIRRTLAVLGALLAVAVVAGSAVAVAAFVVGSPTPTAAPAPAAGVIASSMASVQAPQAFRDRPPFRSCGRIDLGRGEALPADRVACLSATPTEGRELIVVSTTTEGDRVIRYFRTGPGIHGIEVFEDATGDRFDGRWHHTVCGSGEIDQFGACA